MKKIVLLIALVATMVAWAQLGTTYDLERRYYISAGDNDAEQIGRTLNLNATKLEFGDNSTVGLRFTGIDALTQNQRIYKAELRFKAAATSTGSACSDVFFRAFSDVSPFPGTSLTGRQTSDPTVSKIFCNWKAGQRSSAQVVDITSIVQAGLIKNGVLALRVEAMNNGDPAKSVYAYEGLYAEVGRPTLVLFIDED